MNARIQALFEAAQRNDANAVELALNAGASVHVRAGEGRQDTLLGTAILAGALDTVRLLLQRGASAHDTHRQLPVLMLAGMAERHPANIARLLLEHGANPLIPFGNDRTSCPLLSLMMDAERWDEEAANLSPLWDELARAADDNGLLEDAAEPVRTSLLWHWASDAFGHADRPVQTPTAQLLEALDRQFGATLWNMPLGKSLVASGMTMAHRAAVLGDVHTLAWLLAHGANPHTLTPASETTEGYPIAPESLLDLAEAYETDQQPAAMERKAALVALVRRAMVQTPQAASSIPTP